jgi:hypothetical protein
MNEPVVERAARLLLSRRPHGISKPWQPGERGESDGDQLTVEVKEDQADCRRRYRLRPKTAMPSTTGTAE